MNDNFTKNLDFELASEALYIPIAIVYEPDNPFAKSREIHEFARDGMSRHIDGVQTYKLCYCAGFKYYSSEDSLDHCSKLHDYVQDIGYVIMTQAQATDLNSDGVDIQVAIYPTLPFTLKLLCGQQDLPSSMKDEVLGCSGTSEMRYKISPRQTIARKTYYDEEQACKLKKNLANKFFGYLARCEGNFCI